MANRSEHNFVMKMDDRTLPGSKSVNKNISKLDMAFSNLTKRVGVLAGAFGLGALGASLRKNLNQIDLLAKNADKIGITTEAYTELNYAVSQTSALTDQQFNMALQRMARKLGDAELGLGETGKQLEAMGISLEEISKLRPDQQFLMIADAVRKLDDDQKQLAATAKIFDSDAAAIVTTLQKGSEAISDYRDEARKLGVTLTRDQAAKAEAANDAIDKLNRTWTGLTNNLAIALAGPLTDFIKWVAEAVIRVDTLVRKIFDLGVNLNRVSTVELRKEIALLNEEIRKTETIIDSNIAPRSKRGQKARLKRLEERLQAYEARLKQLQGESETFKGTAPGQFNFGQLGTNTGIISKDDDKKKDKADEDLEKRKSSLDRFVEHSRNTAQQFDDMWANSLHRFTSGVGNAFANAIMYGDNLSDGLRGALRGVTHQIISTLTTIGAKKLAIMALEKAGIISTGAVSVGAAATTAAAWAVPAALVSLATLGTNAIPAGAALTTTTALSGTLAAGAGLLGIAHDGLPVVPKTGTYLLEQGEGVYKKQDNQKIRSALDGNGFAGRPVELNITIQALDTTSATQVILQNEPEITNMVQRAFNSNGRPGPLG